jgi:hypothetical protein
MRRLLAIPIAVGVLFAAIFVASNSFALTDPDPHGVPIGVVDRSGDGGARLQAALDAEAEGDFTVTSYASVAAARHAVTHRDVYGAVVADPASPGVFVGGANGLAVQGLFTGLAQQISPVTGGQLAVQDVAPLGDDDSRGLAVQQLVFGMIIPSFLFALFTHQLAAGAPLAARVAASAIYAALAGLIGAVVACAWLGTIDGPFLGVAALGALGALAIAVAAALPIRLLGSPGIGIAAILLIVVGNGVSGASTPHQFLPDVYRQISQYMPTGAMATAVTNTVYFHGAHLTKPLLVLAVWVIAGIGLIGLVDRLRREPATAPT